MPLAMCGRASKYVTKTLLAILFNKKESIAFMSNFRLASNERMALFLRHPVRSSIKIWKHILSWRPTQLKTLRVLRLTYSVNWTEWLSVSISYSWSSLKLQAANKSCMWSGNREGCLSVLHLRISTGIYKKCGQMWNNPSPSWYVCCVLLLGLIECAVYTPRIKKSIFSLKGVFRFVLGESFF